MTDWLRNNRIIVSTITESATKRLLTSMLMCMCFYPIRDELQEQEGTNKSVTEISNLQVHASALNLGRFSCC